MPRDKDHFSTPKLVRLTALVWQLLKCEFLFLESKDISKNKRTSTHIHTQTHKKTRLKGKRVKHCLVTAKKFGRLVAGRQSRRRMQKRFELLKIASSYLYRSVWGHRQVTDSMTCCSMLPQQWLDWTQPQDPTKDHATPTAHSLHTTGSQKSSILLFLLPWGAFCSPGFGLSFIFFVSSKFKQGWRSWKAWSLGSQTLCSWTRSRWSSLWKIWSWGKAWDTVREEEGRGGGGWKQLDGRDAEGYTSRVPDGMWRKTAGFYFV